MKTLFHRQDKERGQGLVEYALILALVSVVAIVILAVVGDSVKEPFCTVAQRLDSNIADCEAVLNSDSNSNDSSGSDSNPEPEPEPEMIQCETVGLGEGNLTYYETYKSMDNGDSWTFRYWTYWSLGNPSCPFPHKNNQGQKIPGSG